MIPDDLQDMSRLDQEQLLYVAGFEPVLENGRELWTRSNEPYLRSRALLVALEELTALGRGYRSFVDSLTDFTNKDEREV